MAEVKKFLRQPKVEEIIAKANEEAAHTHGESEEGWLVSYADMMTLLCGFFIMMFSMAKLDAAKYEAAKESIAKEFKGEYKNPTKEAGMFYSQVIQELGVDKDAIVENDATGVTLTFSSTVFFDPLSSELRFESRQALTKLIDAVKVQQEKNKKEYRVIIEGHTDGRPLVGGDFASNWELSSARSAKLLRQFMDRGFEARQLVPIGYADTYPLVPHRKETGEWNEEGFIKNRRVVLRVLEPNTDGVPVPVSPLTQSAKFNP